MTLNHPVMFFITIGYSYMDFMVFPVVACVFRLSVSYLKLTNKVLPVQVTLEKAVSMEI